MSVGRTAEDIAIVGMSGRFAGASDVVQFWQNILDKVDAINEAPDRWAQSYLDPDSPENDRIYTRQGGFLGEYVDFDPTAFGIMPSSISSGDADHFLALAHVESALKDAGYHDRPFNRVKTGVILGRGTYVNRSYNTLLQHGQTVDQMLGLLRDLLPDVREATLTKLRTALKNSLPDFNGEVIPSFVPNVITGRIANRLDLMGPNYIVDAACASSLVAVSHAVEELRNGHCDMVLTGGTHTTTPPQLYMMFCQLKGLAHNKLRPFDGCADGTLLAEGIGILVLKRLSDAERDGDRIYAKIKAVATCSDGRALGLLAPRKEGQVLAMRKAYEECGIDPATLGLIEAHGTGMPLGDKTEISTLGEIFGPRGSELPRVAVGSVKSMIGHCIPAAGVAGLIKTSLALHDKVLPPTLCETISSEIGIEETTTYINNVARPWVHDGRKAPRRAGVNAFGFGGVNAHAVLEEYRPSGATAERQAHDSWPSELFLFTAPSKPALAEALDDTTSWLTRFSEARLCDLARTLEENRKQIDGGSVRLAVIAKDRADLTGKLERARDAVAKAARPRLPTRAGLVYGECGADAAPDGVVFMFPGEGSQYVNMLSDLCLHVPSVRAWFDLLDEALTDLSDVPPSRVIFPPPTTLDEQAGAGIEARLMTLELGSAAVFTASLALYELLIACNVTCDAMVGHSTGDGTALVASNTARLENNEALRKGLTRFNRAYRDMMHGGRIPQGALLTVGAIDADLVERTAAEAGNSIHIALYNCPNQTVLFGKREDIDPLLDRFSEMGAVCGLLPFDRGYHTALLGDVEPALRDLYSSLDMGPSKVPVYSCTSQAPYPTDLRGIRDLAVRQWFKPVRFRQTVDTLYDNGIRTFVEVGPGTKLTGFVRDILGHREHTALSSNAAGKPAVLQFQLLLGQLFTLGIDVDLAPLFAHRNTCILKEGKADAKHRRVQIDLMMPVMHLDKETAEALRSEIQADLSPGRQAATTSTTTALKDAPQQPTAVNAAANRAIGSNGATSPHGTAGANGTAAAAASAAAPPSSATHATYAADPRMAGMQIHFELMREFLNSQARVMGVLGPKTAQAGAPPAGSPETSRTGKPARGQPANWPLLGRVVEASENRLVCERELSVDQAPFLRDHTIGSPTSAKDPDLLALPVVPFTVSMEIVAEAAACLCGRGFRVVRLFDLRGMRWIALDSGVATLRITAEMLPEGDNSEARQVHVRIATAAEAAEGREKPLFEGCAALAATFPSAKASDRLHLETPNPTNYRSDMLYGEAQPENVNRASLFHGPQFAAVAQIRGWGREGIEAEMRVLSRAALIGAAEPAEFQIDPILLDAAGQLIGYWVAERHGVDLSFFPFSVAEYRQFAELPLPGSTITCRGKIELVAPDGSEACFEFVDTAGTTLSKGPTAGEEVRHVPVRYETCRLQPADAIIRASFEFRDAEGRTLATVNGWSDRYFSVSHRFYRTRLWPQREYFSEPLALPDCGCVCRRIETSREAYLEEGWGIWKRVLAHLVLSRTERELWYSLPEKGGRRTEWLLGRIAAKDAVRQWVQERHGLHPAPADIAILPDRFGRPTVQCDALTLLRPPPAVSITHVRSAVIAAAGEPEAALGVDLANIGEIHSVESLKMTLSAPELELLNGVPEEDHGGRIVQAWCAREAASKAHGTGLQGEPRDWKINGFDADSGRITVSYDNRAYDVRVWQQAREVLAICTTRRD